jgi:hypothetical protein
VTCIASPYTVGGGVPIGSCAQAFDLVPLYHSDDPNVKWIYVWHRVNGGPWRIWLSPLRQNQPGLWAQYYYGYGSSYAPYNSQAATPSTVAPTLKTVTVNAIATGPAAVTARKLYRTKANLTPLLLVTTLANTATTYTDGGR